MKRILVVAILLLAAGAVLYGSTPFFAAWTLREAIKSGDVATLERKVDWLRVRTTLKASIAQHAQLVPEVSEGNEGPKPSLWQRVKVAFGQSMIDSFVERTVTPTGLPQMFEARKTFNEKVRGEPDEAKTLSRTERFRRLWSRIVRAEFLSPTVIEIEMKDRRNPERNYVSVLELSDWEWKLVGLQVKAARPSANASVQPARLLDDDD